MREYVFFIKLISQNVVQLVCKRYYHCTGIAMKIVFRCRGGSTWIYFENSRLSRNWTNEEDTHSHEMSTGRKRKRFDSLAITVQRGNNILYYEIFVVCFTSEKLLTIFHHAGGITCTDYRRARRLKPILVTSAASDVMVIRDVIRTCERLGWKMSKRNNNYCSNRAGRPSLLQFYGN